MLSVMFPAPLVMFCHSYATLHISLSRFYGPQVSSLPNSIGTWVEEYEKSVAFEVTGPNPYLFPLTTDWGRGHSSSGWTQLVKQVFLRH